MSPGDLAVHGALGWLAFALITAGYMYLAQGHPMYGAEGAVTLFVIRQGVALARTAVRFGVLGGQLELGKTRAMPPRRIETKSEAKKAAMKSFVLSVRSLMPALAPYRFGNVAASQLPNCLESGPPLRLLMSTCPFLFCQNPIVAAWPA